MFFKLTYQSCSKNDFVSFWSSCYNQGKYSDSDYLKNLNQNGSLMSKNIQFLFEWKNANPLSKKKQQTVDRIKKNIIEINRFRQLSTISDVKFKNFWFSISNIIKHGFIWRVFLLHITRPQDYPIVDQHVLRAWNFLITGKVEEIEQTMEHYSKYRAFFFDLIRKSGMDFRPVDQALMAFGQFLKTQFAKKIIF